MAKKNENNAVSDADGFVDAHTYSGEDTGDTGEWVQPVEGMVIEGELTRTFFVPPENPTGKPVPAYEVKDSDGNVWLIGEKASFKQAIRATNIGTTIRVTYDKKVKLDKGRTLWVCKFATKNDGKGERVIDALKKLYADAMNAVPF